MEHQMRRSEPLGWAHWAMENGQQSPAIPYKYLEMSIESGKIIYLYYIYIIFILYYIYKHTFFLIAMLRQVTFMELLWLWGLPPSSKPLRNEWRLKYQQLEEKLKKSKEDGPSLEWIYSIWYSWLGFMIHDVNIYTVMCGGRLETMEFVDTCGIQPSGWVPSLIPWKNGQSSSIVDILISLIQSLMSYLAISIIFHQLSIAFLVSLRPKCKKSEPLRARRHRTVRCGPWWLWWARRAKAGALQSGHFEGFNTSKIGGFEEDLMGFSHSTCLNFHFPHLVFEFHSWDGDSKIAWLFQY